MNSNPLESNNIEEGDLVKLSVDWMMRPANKWKLQPCLGIVTSLRTAAGMPESTKYASVLWENNRHMEHYLRDLVKVKE